ncbi:hypothetical protein, partial [Desulfosarcina sp.]|uniref:hypothetical protein n=1 Tax=Desulfosarcina sp. TaxID=2027861 RepID=UPI003970F907
MDQPANPDIHRKQLFALYRAYTWVGVVGVVMLVFIWVHYINARRLDELTSPLWMAIKEVKLEATAVQHEAIDLLRGEIDPASDGLWLYLDQSIWHLATLLNPDRHSSRFWLFMEKTEIGERIKTIDAQLVRLKLFLMQQKGSLKTPESVAAGIARLNLHFGDFQHQLDQVEADIARLMTAEQLQQRIAHAALVLICAGMIALVIFQIRRYERYRRESYESLDRANIQLARQIDERERAELALKESEQLFRTIFETSPDTIV